MDNKKVVHIALVGGQTMPVYLTLESTPAKIFYLIHSSSTKFSAEKMKNDLVFLMGDCSVELREFDPIDFQKAIEGFKELLSKYNDYKIEVNISSGTKPWSIAMAILSERFPNMELLYVSQNSRIYNYRTAEVEEVEQLAIEDIFLYNQTVYSENRLLKDYTEDDLNIIPQIKAVRKKYNIGKPSLFNLLTIPDKSNQNRYTNNVKDTIIDDYTSSKITWDKQYHAEPGDHAQQYVKLSLNNDFGDTEEFEFISPHAFDLVTSSGWFEYEVATVLKKWAGCKQVWLNVKFPYKDQQPQNEIDIIVGTGEKLLFVECKTQIKSVTDIDKFHSAVRNYGGMGAKAIFITESKMTNYAIEKCNKNGIKHFSFTGQNNNKVKHEMLFKILDEIMELSNTR